MLEQLEQLTTFLRRLIEDDNGSVYYTNTSELFFLAKWLAILALISLILAAIIYFRRPAGRQNHRFAIPTSLGLAVFALVLGFSSAYLIGSKLDRPLIFSERFMLESLWRSYKQEFLETETGRTLDPQRDNITTSEGQSYTMLRAVWMGDKPTFDQVWEWTKENLQREDKLFAWLYGRRQDGSFGILTERNGQNAASDADVDIALALVFAYARWQDDAYLEEAYEIIPQIWEEQVIIAGERPLLLANNIDKRSPLPNALVNPSYFAPYAYRIFATIDQRHPWNRLAESSYDIIEESMRLPLDREASVHLPPDWILVDKRTGTLSASLQPELSTNYGYDAMRVPWRLALDAEWFSEPRAREIIRQMSFLGDEWRREGRLATTYTHDGRKILARESPAMYGTAIAYFAITDPEQAKILYREKLVSLYRPDYATWKIPLSYYDDNLAWFGLALYNRSLPNLHVLNLESLR